jgi:hypothetical protein
MTQSGHAFAAQQFPKGQLTARTFDRPLVSVWEWPGAVDFPEGFGNKQTSKIVLEGFGESHDRRGRGAKAVSQSREQRGA